MCLACHRLLRNSVLPLKLEHSRHCHMHRRDTHWNPPDAVFVQYVFLIPSLLTHKSHFLATCLSHRDDHLNDYGRLTHQKPRRPELEKWCWFLKWWKKRTTDPEFHVQQRRPSGMRTELRATRWRATARVRYQQLALKETPKEASLTKGDDTRGKSGTSGTKGEWQEF